MAKYAEKTTVRSADSRIEIERVLMRYGANGFIYGRDDDANVAMIGFRLGARVVRFRLPLPDRSAREFHSVGVNGRATRPARPDEHERLYDRAERQRWRALVLVIKAKLEAVEAGIVSVEDEFLAWTMLNREGPTVGEWAGPQIEEAYRTGGMPSLLPGVAPKALPEPAP